MSTFKPYYNKENNMYIVHTSDRSIVRVRTEEQAIEIVSPTEKIDILHFEKGVVTLK